MSRQQSKRKRNSEYKLEQYLSSSRCKETGKRQYKRVEAGEKLYNAMWLNEQLGYEERKEKNIYQCPYCNAWHLTSQRGTLTSLYETAVRDNMKEKK